jgi:hypothetical protein
MRNRIIMLTLLLTSLTMSVTAGKNSYMGKVQSVVSDVEKDSTMSDAEFAKKKAKMDALDKDYDKYRKDMSSDDKKELGRLHARFYKATAAREMKGVSSDLQDAIDEASGFLEELMKDNNEENNESK